MEKEKTTTKPPQEQELPGLEQEMKPKPVSDNDKPGSDKLKGKVALITGGDSGIGKAVALLFAKEGADVAIVYMHEEQEDAEDTRNIVEGKYDRTCLLIPGNIREEQFCREAVEQTVQTFNRIDILVNNAAVQYASEKFEDITTEHLKETFETNIYAMFWLTKAALPYMKEGSSIINTSSVTAYRGSPQLVDYASTKGAIVAFTRSLSASLVERGIRVNGVAPGPIWTPLIPASFDAERTSEHGSSAPMKRAGEPVEVAPSYLFLACEDSSYITGQFLHPNGGEIINS